VTVRYRLGAPDSTLHGRWAVQWNLALSAGAAPGRYLTLTGHPSLGSTGRVAGAMEVTLVDEWLGLDTHLAWSPAAELAWGPVETVSVSEAGFERIYQGLALLLAWPLGGGHAEIAVTLTVSER
jgi:alpha-amylase